MILGDRGITTAGPQGAYTIDPHDVSMKRAAADPLATVGPYKILGSLGAGGGGVVYRAWDPRLRPAL